MSIKPEDIVRTDYEPALMPIEEIALHERSLMQTRYRLGVAQHDQHTWCWLVEMLRIWGKAHPITIKKARRG